MRHNYSSYVQMLTSQQKFMQVGEAMTNLVAANDDKADTAITATKNKKAPDA